VLLSLLAAFNATAQYSEQDLMDEANSLFDKGEFAEAMPLYSQLLSLNPTNAFYNYRFGATALYGDTEKKEEAVKFLKFAVGKIDETDSWYFLGKAYHLNYQFEDALNAYEKFKSLASKKDLEGKNIDLNIAMATSGQSLLTKIKEITVLDKKKSTFDAFFRVYDLSDIGGKILVTPEELLSPLDKKREHTSLIHFRGTGTTVYFSSYGKTGKTGLDIYSAQVLPDGSFTDPILVQGSVNTPHDEDFPFLHPDDKTFYFSSKGHGSMGGFDVYKSAFDLGSGIFSKPVNLDFAVNTPDDDLFYIADSLNKMAYFASARSSKQGDLDVYKVLVKSASLDITLIKGTFLNQIDPSRNLAKITTIDASTNKEIDVQYTDPETGEYVLSFPRGGRYKFLVEEKESDKIHAGLVDIPNSNGVNAYLQEMELISTTGVEKLLINNLFDQAYEGDIMALAQKMLRQRAALDVNFDPTSTNQGADDLVSADKDPSKAYAAAGFSGGMSNETILEQAEARVEELKNRQILTAQLAVVAAEYSNESFETANEDYSKALNLLDAANGSATDAKNKGMFDAGFKKIEGETALQAANSSKSLSIRLQEQAIESEEFYQSEKERVNELREAIDASDFDAILSSLKKEKGVRDNINKSDDQFDLVYQGRLKNLEAEKKADQLLERAQSLRDQEESMNKTLITRRTQSEKMKGKALKQVKEEIVILESDIESMRRKSEGAFAQAQDAQKEAFTLRQEYKILEELSQRGDSISPDYSGTPTIAWTEEDRLGLQEEFASLNLDEEALASYLQENPDILTDIDSESFAMEFKKAFGVESIAVSKEVASDNDELVEEDQDETPQATELEADTEEELMVSETNPSTQNNNVDAEPDSEVDLATTDTNSINTSEDTLEDGEDLLNFSTEEGLALEYDESLPVNKRIEAEEIKIKAAEDWVAIIDESISQLENGTGGEDGAEEQLAEYKRLKSQKQSEIEQRQSLINEWANEGLASDSQDALDRATADIDTLSPSLVARLESRIPEYSTAIESIKAVSLIDRDYLPALTEIEISGLSAPELARERIRLNQQLVADIDQIISQGIESDVSDEDLLEMRRIKALEMRIDEEILDGKVEYSPRSSEAQEYAELLSEVVSEEEPQRTAKIEAGEEFTALSPSIIESLEKRYNKELILPDYSNMLDEAELTTNQTVGAVQRIKIKEDFLVQLQSEISLYKEAIDAAKNPNPSLIQRYSVLLKERSGMIDDLNDERLRLEEGYDNIAQIEIEPADSVILYIREEVLSDDEEVIPEAKLAQVDQIISSQIDEYVEILDDPTNDVDRDQLQLEIQKIESFQAELSNRSLDESSDLGILIEENDTLQPSVNSVEELAETSASSETEELSTKENETAKTSINSREAREFIETIEYKSLNASIFQSYVSVKSDSLDLLSNQLNQTEDETSKARLQADIERLNEDIRESIHKSNIAEIEYFKSENQRIISEVDLSKTSKREDLLTLQDRFNQLESQVIDVQEYKSLDAQRVLISELAELNAALVDFDSPEEDESTNLVLNDITSSILSPESHDKLPESAYLTAMQAQIVNQLNSDEKNLIESSEPLLTADYNFSSSDDQLAVKKALISEKTNIDEIGLELLAETPLQLDYLTNTIKSDSLEELEFLTADLATQKQAAAIERSTEARRLFAMVANQESDSDKENVAERAKKLEGEAEVLYKQSALAAQRAEDIRKTRISTDKELLATAQQLSKKEKLALQAMLQSVGYYLIPTDESSVDEVAEDFTDNQPSSSDAEAEAKKETAYIEDPVNDSIEAPVITDSKPEISPEEKLTENITSTYVESSNLAEIKGNWLNLVEVIAEKEDFSDVDKSMFVEATGSLYSADNPIPVDPVMPEGLIFQVQVGAYRNPIPQDLFGAYAPIMGQKLDNGITRYRAGLFKKYDEATEAKNEIIAKGYSDAFVVVYVNGEKLTGDQAREILEEAQAGQTVSVELVSGIPTAEPVEKSESDLPIVEQSTQESSNIAQEVPDYYDDPNAADASQVEVIAGLFYTVQVGVYSNPVKLDQLFNLTELNSELTESGVIRYTSGRFGNLETASARKNQAVSKGVGDAFIIAYHNGKRVSLSEAKNILEAEGTSAITDQVTDGTQRATAAESSQSDSQGASPLNENNSEDSSTNEESKEDSVLKKGESYAVIMGSYAGAVPEELANIFLENPEWKIRKIEFPGAGAIYLTQEIRSLDEAKRLLDECKRLNIGSASIGTMKNGQITSVQID